MTDEEWKVGDHVVVIDPTPGFYGRSGVIVKIEKLMSYNNLKYADSPTPRVRMDDGCLEHHFYSRHLKRSVLDELARL